MRGLERKVVESKGDGNFSLRGGSGTAGIFWHGERGEVSRPVHFSYEGLISVASASELADKGWSAHQIDFEVLGYSFDLGVFDRRSNRMLVVSESKTKPSEVDRLIAQIERCGRRGHHEKSTCPGSKLGHSKYSGLIAGRPALMWITAPGIRRLFCPVYLGAGHVSLVETSCEELLRKPRRLKVASAQDVVRAL